MQRETLYVRGRRRGVLGRRVVFPPLGEEWKAREAKSSRSLSGIDEKELGEKEKIAPGDAA